MARQAGYNLSKGFNLVIQNLLHPLPSNPDPWTSNGSKLHLAFFGRLEAGKGLLLFMDALDLLVARSAPIGTISFVGAETRVFGKRSLHIIGKRSEAGAWPWTIETKTEFGTTVRLTEPKCSA